MRVSAFRKRLYLVNREGELIMPNSIFSDRLNDSMNKQGMKQVDLLRAANEEGVKLGKSQISQYVSGKAVPRENIGNFLAKVLKVDLNWLYGKNVTEYISDKEKTTTYNEKEISGISNIKDLSDEYTAIERKVNMREFKKSTKLDNVLYDVRGPVVDEAERMEESGTHILKLNIGNPAPFGFRTPDEVVYDMQRQITEIGRASCRERV